MDFKKLLALMCHKKASNLFITAGRAACMTIDGELIDVSKAVLSKEQTFRILESIMNASQKMEFEKTKDCQFAIDYPDLGRFRVSAFTQCDAVGMVLHRVEHHIPDVDELNLPPVLTNLIMEKRGLIIFVGEKNVGKSTTLAALLKHRNQNSRGHILTIEDPIKFQHTHLGCVVTQREVGVDTESYELALKNALYQAPTVIFIGEIKTQETMQNAIMFAKKGCLCLATFHASVTTEAFDRILQLFPNERHQPLLEDLCRNLKGMVAQKLVITEDGQRRYPVVEILLNTSETQTYIYKGEFNKLREIMDESEELGMQTLDGSLFHLYETYKISYFDAINSASYSRSELALRIRMKSKCFMEANPHLYENTLSAIDDHEEND